MGYGNWYTNLVIHSYHEWFSEETWIVDGRHTKNASQQARKEELRNFHWHLAYRYLFNTLTISPHFKTISTERSIHTTHIWQKADSKRDAAQHTTAFLNTHIQEPYWWNETTPFRHSKVLLLLGKSPLNTFLV